MKKDSILFIIQHLHQGGSEGTIAKLSRSLSDYFDIHIATFFSEQDYTTTYTYNGTLHPLNETKEQGGLRKIRRRVNHVNRIVDDFNIIAKISFLQNADLINALTARKNIATIVGIRTSVSILLASYKSRLLYKYIFRRCDNVVVQNRENMDLINSVYGTDRKDKISIIPNAFDCNEIIECSSEPIEIARDLNDVILVSVGSYYHIKGHLHLFKILYQLKKNVENPKLILTRKSI